MQLRLAIVLTGTFIFAQVAFADANPNFTSSVTNHVEPMQKLTAGKEIVCACSGAYKTGDRVRMIDKTGNNNPDLIDGVGTVVKGSSSFRDPHILVSWDSFNKGHIGSNSREACPHNDALPGASGWWVTCNMIEKLGSDPTPSPGLAGCVRYNSGNAAAYEAVLRQPGVLTVAKPLDHNQCYRFENPVRGKPYEISISGSL